MSDYKVFVAYSQMHLAPDGVNPTFAPAQADGLTIVTDAGRGLVILTGITMGHVRVRIPREHDKPSGHHVEDYRRIADSDRETDHDGGWEQQAVVQLDVTQTLYLTSPTVEDGNFWPVYQPARPGWRTVTVLARGRSVVPGGIAQTDEPCEDYFLIFTPTEQAPVTLKAPYPQATAE